MLYLSSYCHTLLFSFQHKLFYHSSNSVYTSFIIIYYTIFIQILALR